MRRAPLFCFSLTFLKKYTEFRSVKLQLKYTCTDCWWKVTETEGLRGVLELILNFSLHRL